MRTFTSNNRTRDTFVMGLKAKVFVIAEAISGEVKLSNFKLIEEILPALRDGQFLAEAVFISVDPYQRNLMSNLPAGTTVIGRQVAR